MAGHYEYDIVPPEQFFERVSPSAGSGERELMLAVLEEAIRCFQGHRRDKRSDTTINERQVEEWIRANDYNWPFSFNVICETLGLDVSATRARLLAWKTEQRVKQQSPRASPRPKERICQYDFRKKRTAGIR